MKNEKIHSHKFKEKEPVMLQYQYNFRLEGSQFYEKGTPSLMLFCKICEVLQNLIFTENYRATASDFQYRFGLITGSISNKTTQSHLTVCLGPPQRAACKQFTVFVSKTFKITGPSEPGRANGVCPPPHPPPPPPNFLTTQFFYH